MLTLVEGGFYSGNHEKIKERIAALLENGKKALLIVPEQQTVSAEHEMTDYLPSDAALCFEVTNFTRFANTVFRSLGGLAKNSADSSKRALLMWRTLTELAPTLEAGNKGEISAGAVKHMLSAVKQMQSLSISPEALLGAAAALKDSRDTSLDRRLISKLNDISRIMTLYKKLLSEHFSDSDDDLILAENKLSTCKSGFLTDTEIFIDGFASFTEPQYRVINTLIKHTSVTVVLTLPKASSEAFEYSEIREAHQRLVRLANEQRCDVKLERTDSQKNAPNPLFADTLSLIFRSTGKLDKDFLSLYGETLTVYEAETPYDECDFITQDIKMRVMGGAKYSDFGILARSISAYDGILNVAFEKAEIPLFLSTNIDIESYEVIKLIYSALAIITGGYSRRDVITYAKCSLCGVPRGRVDEFELYAEKWQITGTRFTDGMTWNMNPDGYTDRIREDSEEKLLRIDEVKGMIITPLMKFEEQLSKAKNVKEQSAALVDFLVSLNVESKLKEKSAEPIHSIGGRDTGRLWKIICDSLDSLCETVGELECTTEVFTKLLKITFSEGGTGRIPAYTEQVVAGSADTARLYGKKHIYIIGASYGVFPARVEDDSYFSDKDKSILCDMGLSIKKDTDVRSAREFYYFLRAISYARSDVKLIYPANDTGFKPIPSSEVITRLSDLSDGAIKPRKISSLSSLETVFTREYALEHLSEGDSFSVHIRQALIDTGAEERLIISDGKIINTGLKLSKESTDSIYGTMIPMTQGRIDKFVSCPMSYFCQYNLKLGANRRAEFGSNNIGTFIHAILEKFFFALKERGKAVADITDAEKDELIKSVAKEYTRGFFERTNEPSARLRNTINKLCRMARPIIDGLCDEFSDCKYEPVFFELKIDNANNGLPNPAIFDTGTGKQMYIYGTMDRVDTYKCGGDVYVRVIDYKTGGKDFSPSDLENGENLQMFLYLKSITETDSPSFRERVGVGDGGKIIPAGVIYVKTSINDRVITTNNADQAEESVKKNQLRLGMILDDPESIAAMNTNFIPVKFKSNGEPDSHSRAKLYTLDGWAQINETINRVISDIIRRMTEGDIDAIPLKRGGKGLACQYCDFKPICRNAK